jgi:hypothetical protein
MEKQQLEVAPVFLPVCGLKKTKWLSLQIVKCWGFHVGIVDYCTVSGRYQHFKEQCFPT